MYKLVTNVEKCLQIQIKRGTIINSCKFMDKFTILSHVNHMGCKPKGGENNE